MLVLVYMLNRSETNIPSEKQPTFIFKKPCFDFHILLNIKEVDKIIFIIFVFA
jgi:hypothetical protein